MELGDSDVSGLPNYDLNAYSSSYIATIQMPPLWKLKKKSF